MDDSALALQAAISMCNLHKEDVIIVRDYQTKLLKDKGENEEIFETIRYPQERAP